MPQLVVKLKERELRTLPIDRPTMTIGRDADNDLVIDNVGVSRLHASVSLEGTDFMVRDLSSANGVFVNGRRVDAHPFRDGDQIQIGKFVVELDEHGGPDRMSARRDADILNLPRPNACSPVETTHMTPKELKAALEAGALALPDGAWPEDALQQREDAHRESMAARNRTLSRTVAGLTALTLTLATAVLYLTFAG